MKKVALLFIALNPNYWQYAKEVIEGAQKYFLPNQKIDYLLWSDIPPDTNYGATVFETEPVQWPYPTLLRYHLFLQQEEKLKEYDYVFYCDIDMRFVDTVGDEILGDGITATQHPMYAVRKEFKYPYETNPESSAYIYSPQYYFAGGFQGGKTEDFIKAMRWCKNSIDSDFNKNYIARWNEESHWNKYLFNNPPAVILNPSYCKPDSLIEEYYRKLWGCDYPAKLITLTKKFTTSKEGGDAIKGITETL